MASQSTSRRKIVAAVGAVSIGASVLLIAVSSRLGSEPSTTTSPRRAAATTTAFPEYPVASANPLRLYPRRPGAKYDDVEAKPGSVISLGLARFRLLTWKVEPHSALPAGSKPAKPGPYSSLDLIDGYAPYSTSSAGAVLHVVLRSNPSVGLPVSCVATAASDGTSLVPYDHAAARASSTTSTTFSGGIVDHDFYLPLGVRRGRFYFTCRFEFLLFDSRFLWGIDV